MEKSSGSGDERVRAAARAVSQGDITELSRLPAPPQGVKNMMEAVQLLLGRPVHIATDYGKALALLKLRGPGKESLVQQIHALDVHQVDMEAALKAKQALAADSVETMQNKSMASVSLFNWARAMVEAVESRGEGQTSQGK
ncbi:hypothetical protein RRG08_017089 [Elysia crispata]|uniref:Uncharacterized protein n=1 Tax=Elysia crispata TaxID=231223 RepID=A0AAE0ZVH4_9GAST|nr:hypothetical protein RRG08_017089 [Elysia crispata]